MGLSAIHAVCAAYRRAHGRWPNLLRPRRYSEKMQWRKLFDRNPLFPVLCDKLAVRDFISGRVGDDRLIPLLWAGHPAELPLARLTPPYVVKSTHGYGQVIMVHGQPDVAEISARAAAWVSAPYGIAQCEPGYREVPRRIMIEAMLTMPDGAPPEEQRLFVFGGKVGFINTVFVEDGAVRNGAFHTPDWQRLDWYFNRKLARAFARPQRLAEMIGTAEALGAGLDHVRVDFYDCGARFYAGEITVYSWSGLSRFHPDEADFLLGAAWRLRTPLRRTLSRVSRAGF